MLQHLLRRLEKKKDADGQLRRDLEATVRRLYSFIFARENDVEMVPWKDFVRTSNVVKGVILKLIKVCVAPFSVDLTLAVNGLRALHTKAVLHSKQMSSFGVVSRLWPSLVTEIEASLLQQPSTVDDIIFSIPQSSQEFSSLCAWLKDDFLPFLGAKVSTDVGWQCRISIYTISTCHLSIEFQKEN